MPLAQVMRADATGRLVGDFPCRRPHAFAGASARVLAILAALAGLPAGGVAVAAQSGPQSYPVVQSLPDPNDPGRALSAALVQLGRNPRDSEALISAGNAALVMGDVDAASGFFNRADRLSPNSPRVQAGLASAMIRNGDPVGSLSLFDGAAQGGALTADLLADRGLAYDLLGDNLTAQRYYRQALAMGANDEAMRRLGLSLAIAGDRRGMEATISPLLQKQDRASWRVRAFAFAILGREEEAVAIANATMPQDLAMGIAPYLRYMRRLTPAQQAAAANLGRFPQASEIGRDEPRIAAYAAEHQLRRLAGADAGLVPSGEALGRARGSGHLAMADGDEAGRKRRPSRSDGFAAAAPAVPVAPAPANVAPPEPMPSRESEAVGDDDAPPARPTKPVLAKPALAKVDPVRPPVAKPEFRAVGPEPVPPPPPTTTPVVVKPPVLQPAVPAKVMGPSVAETDGEEVPAVRPPAPAVIPAAPVREAAVAPGMGGGAATGGPAMSGPGFDLARVLAVPVTRPAPAPAPVASPAPPPAPRKRNFAEAFGELAKVKVDTVPAAGAVDIRKIAPPRPVPKAPPPPAHPSRIWVQLGVGRDADRLAYDFRRMKREDPEIFRSKKPFTAEWARTNRLLVGPFETEAAAKAFNERLHKADHDGSHVWISPAGQVVDELDGD